MKRNILITLVVITIIFIVCFQLNNHISKIDYMNKIYSEIKTKNEISFEKIINFKWDFLMVIYPYSNLTQLEKKYKLDLSIVSNSIEYSDNISTLVFVYNNKAIQYFEIPRDKFEFSNTYGKILKADSKFKIKKNNNKLYLELSNKKH